ncbi:hypothetical protein ACQ4PT_054239 [Festuca glaucescens]
MAARPLALVREPVACPQESCPLEQVVVSPGRCLPSSISPSRLQAALAGALPVVSVGCLDSVELGVSSNHVLVPVGLPVGGVALSNNLDANNLVEWARDLSPAHPVDFKGRRLDRWDSPTLEATVAKSQVVVDEAVELAYLGDPSASSWEEARWDWTQAQWLSAAVDVGTLSQGVPSPNMQSVEVQSGQDDVLGMLHSVTPSGVPRPLVDGLASPVRGFISEVEANLQTPILGASACRKCRVLRAIPPDFKPRRSDRVALDRRCGSSALQKAQCNLAKKMGIVEDEGKISDQDLQRYLDAFNRGLSSSEVGALALLFSIQVGGESGDS